MVIAALALGQQQCDEAALLVAGGVQLKIQAALGAADVSRTPFCSRLAAVRCALRWVASIISRLGAPPLAARAAKMRANMPSGSNARTGCRASCAAHTPPARPSIADHAASRRQSADQTPVIHPRQTARAREKRKRPREAAGLLLDGSCGCIG